MDWRERIVRDPQILLGKPTVRGTRISVSLVLGFLSSGCSVDCLIENYPHLTPEDIYACLAYASEVLDDMTMYKPYLMPA